MKIGKEKVYVFDVCGTLYHSNTTYDFLQFYFKDKNKLKYLSIRFFNSQFGKLIFFILIKLGFNKDFRAFFVRFLKGEKIYEVEKYAQLFLHCFLNSKNSIEIQTKLKTIQAQNRRVVLISASIEPIIKVIANHLLVMEYFASTLETTTSNVYTGKWVKDIKGSKIEIVENTLGLKKDEFFIYTDNLDDIEVIAISTKAVVISKRRNLKSWKSLLKPYNHVDLIHV